MPTDAIQAYPDPRTERNPPGSTPTPVLAARVAAPPRSRHFTVEHGSQAQSRTTISTPRLVGPVVIQHVVWKHRAASDPPTFSLELGWSRFAINETQVALTAPKGWNALQQRLRSPYETPLPLAIGYTQVNTAGTPVIEQWETPILVAEPEVFLTLCFLNYSLVNPAASWIDLQLLEGISPEVAANFH